MDYKEAGVDVEAGYKAVELMKNHVKSTFRKEVLTDIGGFGGLFSLSAAKSMEEPVLVSGTDGVGTKLKLAFVMDKHNTIGIDAVAMCVNDVVCSGAEPLFFLDYIACGKNVPEKIAEIVSGVAEGCRQAGCSLIGVERIHYNRGIIYAIRKKIIPSIIMFLPVYVNPRRFIDVKYMVVPMAPMTICLGNVKPDDLDRLKPDAVAGY